MPQANPKPANPKEKKLRPGKFLDALQWVKSLVKSTLRPRPRRPIWQWIDAGNVSIPLIVGSPNPGPLRTDRFPIYRGLYDLIQQPHVHFFTFCSSVRTGKTLLSICTVLWWIAERCGGPILWLDPTRKAAIKFSNTELDPFIRECPDAWNKAIVSKTTWTTLEKFFRGVFLRLVGAGAESDLHGFQAECVVVNEADNRGVGLEAIEASANKAIARSNQFEHTRLVIRNSTPVDELGYIWQCFLQGSMHYCYLPCPHCGTWQRLTFFSEKKEVPFAIDGTPLEPGKTRTEVTGQVRFEQFAIHEEREIQPGKIERIKVGYDMVALERGATYECAHCKADIERTDLTWMLDRAEAARAEGNSTWWAHNRHADPEHVSVHLSSLYSPFQTWGRLAKTFLTSKGNAGRMRKFHNLDLGLPFIRYATTVKQSDLERVIARCPKPYLKGQLPFEPVLLSMSVDVGGMVSGNFWWSIRAWGILWDHPDLPTWSALIDWGPAVSWEQIEEFAALREDAQGQLNEYTWRDPATGEIKRFRVIMGLVDSGYEAKEDKNVYEFCLRHDAVFSPSKGGGQQHLRGGYIRPSPQKYGDYEFELIWYWDEWFKQALYYHAIKEGRNLWFLPTNIDEDYQKQLTAERTEERNGKLEWIREGANHLADTEKEHEVMRDFIEDTMSKIREEHLAKEAEEG